MDFDDEDKPKEVTKTRRFVPGKSKPKPTSQTHAPSESVIKTEHNVDAKFKVEPEVYTGSVKLEIDSNVNKIEVDQIQLHEEEEEDAVVREIDVFFNPSIEPNTKVSLSLLLP